MSCRKMETWLLRSLDGRLDETRTRRLEIHLKTCPGCARMSREYRTLLGLLRREDEFEPLPNFWERLRSRIARTEPQGLLILWQTWCLRAVPVIMGLALLIVAGLFLLVRPGREPMIQQGLILLSEQNAVSRTHDAFSDGKGEDLSLQLVFASLDEGNGRKGNLP